MKTIKLESSNLSSVTFDHIKHCQDIKIRFNSGTTYIYESVPLSVIEDLISAESAGKFFNLHIKNFYKFKKES